MQTQTIRSIRTRTGKVIWTSNTIENSKCLHQVEIYQKHGNNLILVQMFCYDEYQWEVARQTLESLTM